MSCKDEYHPKVKSDLKRLDKPVVREIYDVHIDRILLHPFANENLRGDLEGASCYHFRKNKVDYRIAYSVDDSRKVVCFLMMATRENFYELLKRRLL